MSLIGDLLADYALISSPVRAISFLVPHITIEELHTDDLAVTDHPVETGAAISDHAFKLPARVEMRCGWSNSTAGTEGFVQEVVAALDSIQARREPFELYTGKKFYPRMLLGRIAIETNAEAENAVLAVLGFREVLITSTQTTGGGAPNSAQGMPERTGSVSERGEVVPSFAGGSFSPGSNTEFSGSGGLQSIGPSGASAGFDEIQFDGVTQPSGLAPVFSEGSPSDLGGNPGLFGRYGPNAYLGATPQFSSGFRRI